MIKQIHLNECDSTQDVLKEQLKQASPEEQILVSCELQLHGRGRGSHSWTALPGTLCFSMNIDPHPAPSFTAIELSVLIARFFEGSKLGLKWPNDIWNSQKKKCCGILVQSHQGKMMAGIGINLCSTHPEFGGVYESQFEYDKKSWAFELAKFINQHRYHSVEALKRDWESHCWHMNKLVRIVEGDEVSEGVFKGLGQYGEAVLNTNQGEVHLYNGSLRLFTDH